MLFDKTNRYISQNTSVFKRFIIFEQEVKKKCHKNFIVLIKKKKTKKKKKERSHSGPNYDMILMIGGLFLVQ